jgi:hypothetical protein
VLGRLEMLRVVRALLRMLGEPQTSLNFFRKDRFQTGHDKFLKNNQMLSMRHDENLLTEQRV